MLLACSISTWLDAVIRSVRDIDQNKNRRFLYSGLLRQEPSTKGTTLPPVELADTIKWRLPSPSGAKIAILHQGQKEDEPHQQVLEIWSDYGHTLQRRILLDKKQHGKVIYDAATFGKPVWNAAETALVYLAERIPPKTKSFFEQSSNKGDEDEDETAIVGGQNVLGQGKSEHWGEQYHQQTPLLDMFVLHIGTGNMARVKNVPSSDRETTLDGYSLGQVVFAPSPDNKGNDKDIEDSLVYVAWDAGSGSEMPRRLGLVYCQQRSSKIYQSSIRNLLRTLENDTANEMNTDDDTAYQCLTPDMRLARSPRFAPLDKAGKRTMVFLGSEKGFDTHSGCWALYTMDWESQQRRILIDRVDDPRESNSSCDDTVSALSFPGLFLQQLPESCFLSPDCLVLTSQWGSTSQVVQVSLSDRKLSRISCSDNCEDSCKLLSFTSDDSILVTTESPGRPAQVCRVVLSSTPHIESMMSFKPIAASRFSPLLPISLAFSVGIDIRKAPSVGGVDFDLDIQSVLLLPAGKHGKPPPLIVVPHGGPHGASCTNYLPSYAFLCGHGGYAILMVNYRGSTGFGQASIESLPSNIGTLDVADVIHVTEQIQKSGLVDPERIGICGGSHGGFLTGHCTGQHPGLFRAAAMRNPVVNIPSMVTATDIPDWCFVESCGVNYNWSEYRPPSAEELLVMRKKSPIAHVTSVKTPTLVALGLEDLRVPPSQGLEWYHTLRSRGIPTKLLTYGRDNHAIAGVQSEADHWIQIKQWFDEHLDY